MRGGWNRNLHYHDIVLNAVPAGCERALDAGCGIGHLASRLAGRCRDVVAIDADAAALTRARSECERPNVTFMHGDVMSHPYDAGTFDFITLVAVLHHLPLEPALERFKLLLKPRGVLAVIGLYRLTTLADFAWAHAGLIVSTWYRATNTSAPVAAPIQEPKETLAEIRTAAEGIVPGADLRRRLLFRYSLVWRKP
jgi:2-polyprenyl-3-methyl-5-hydroxy-6-metoxy-1,4-benzoquinol methylase